MSTLTVQSAGNVYVCLPGHLCSSLIPAILFNSRAMCMYYVTVTHLGSQGFRLTRYRLVRIHCTTLAPLPHVSFDDEMEPEPMQGEDFFYLS